MSAIALPLGRYLPVESPIHRLDGRFKLLAALAYVVALFTVDGWGGVAVLAGGAVLVAVLGRVPFAVLWRGLRPLLLLVAITVVFQAVGYPGEPLLELGPLSITWEGLSRGAFLGLRIVLLLVFSALLTLTTPAVLLTDAVEWMLRPLRRIGLDSHELALMMTIALRFIPTLLEELNDLIRAQRARGVEFSARRPGRLAQALMPLAVPLFVLSFRRADDLAVAMVSRCYRGGRERTRYREMRFAARDLAAAVLLVAWLAIAVVWGRL